MFQTRQPQFGHRGSSALQLELSGKRELAHFSKTGEIVQSQWTGKVLPDEIQHGLQPGIAGHPAEGAQFTEQGFKKGVSRFHRPSFMLVFDQPGYQLPHPAPRVMQAQRQPGQRVPGFKGKEAGADRGPGIGCFLVNKSRPVKEDVTRPRGPLLRLGFQKQTSPVDDNDLMERMVVGGHPPKGIRLDDTRAINA